MFGMYGVVDAGFDDGGLEEMMSFVCGLLKRLKLLLMGKIGRASCRERV